MRQLARLQMLAPGVTCGRATVPSAAGSRSPVKSTNPCTSILHARCVFLLVMLPSHSISGGTSASSLNCAGVNFSLLIGRDRSPPALRCLNAIMYFIGLAQNDKMALC
jgi:hypothetical protein